MVENLKVFDLSDLIELEKSVKDEIIHQFTKCEFEEYSKQFLFKDDKFICKHCQSTNTIKVGFNATNKQRYKCNDCNKIMIETTGMINFSSKKSFNQWILFLESLLNGDTLEVSADKANISERTSFRWRHKILFALNKLLNQEVLSDVVTLDETLFPVVYKNPNRPSIEVYKRGMSSQKVNVTCAIDSHQNILLKVVDYGRVKSDSLISVYKDKIRKDCTVVSDSLRSYHKLMEVLEVDWEKIPSKKKKSPGEYTLEPINRLHSTLKDFIYKYKGISIKYLQGYLALFAFSRKYRKVHQRKVLFSVIKSVFCIKSHISCRVLDSNVNIY